MQLRSESLQLCLGQTKFSFLVLAEVVDRVAHGDDGPVDHVSVAPNPTSSAQSDAGDRSRKSVDHLQQPDVHECDWSTQKQMYYETAPRVTFESESSSSQSMSGVSAAQT